MTITNPAASARSGRDAIRAIAPASAGSRARRLDGSSARDRMPFRSRAKAHRASKRLSAPSSSDRTKVSPEFFQCAAPGAGGKIVPVIE
jgi:hypothetical protein